MKKGITLAVSLMLSAFLLVGSTPAEPTYLRLRKTIPDDTLPLSNQIEQDLAAGVWVEETKSDSRGFLEFGLDGEATLLESNGDFTYELTRYSWEIEATSEHPLLSLRNRNTQETQLFRLDPTRTGIQLTQLCTGKTVAYAYRPVDAGQVEAVKAALTGEWRNTRAHLTLAGADCGSDGAVKLEEASIVFEFHSDGAFSKVISSGTRNVRFEEHGRWEVSNDAEHILLHTSSADGKTITQCVRIKYLELDELVLETPLAVVGRTFTSVPNNDFYFNKL